MGSGEFMRVVTLESGKADIETIRANLARYGKSPVKNFRITLQKFRHHIAKMPEMYPVCEYNPAFRAAVLIYDYVLFYKIDTAAKTVNVFRILHSSRNLADIIKKSN